MRRLVSLVVLALAVTSATACATVGRRPHVADLQANPGFYQHRTVRIDGTVTTSWGSPYAPFKLYRVTDGTGELTVVAKGGRVPTRGTRVQVRGSVSELAVVNGQPLGLHMRESHLKIER